MRLRRAGFYGFRERIAATHLNAGTTTPCALAAETALVAPAIVTGRGDVAAPVPAAAAAARRPTRVSVASLGIDAQVVASGIDVVHGALGIPTDVHRTGWWRDGALPGDPAGAVLLAGHVDSADAGAGAFFALHRIRPGDEVRLSTASAGGVSYRVTAVRSYRKSALPTSVYSSKGRARLVIVTCGGPFDEATGHYRDDVVVTALPER